MAHESEVTRWTLIRGAAAGRTADREEFASRYEPIIRAYLGARWHGTLLIDELDDAAQEVLLACLREGGALSRVDPARPGKFRSFLFRVVLNIARQLEGSRARRFAREKNVRVDLDAFDANQETASRAFDRAWAGALLAQAAELQEARAADLDEAARRRVELLGLRFGEGLPIREIAARWNADPAQLHREYSRARREFRNALREIVRAGADGGTAAEIDAECERLIEYFR